MVTDTLTDDTSTVTAEIGYGWDCENNLVSKTIDLASNTGAGDHTYTYDRASRLTSCNHGGNPAAQPACGEAAPAGETYTYDNRGNRLTVGSDTFTYDNRNRLLSDPDGTYTWSEAGAMETYTPTSGPTDTYGRDAAHRLAEVDDGTVDLDYGYDSLDRITNRGTTSGTDEFAYTGGQIDPTSDGTDSYARTTSGNLLAVGDPITVDWEFPLTDLHGDLVALIEPDGSVAGTSTYNPWGEVEDQTGGTTGLGYQGDWTDPDTDLVWMGARWYQPSSATFLTRDTYSGELSTPFSLNRYTYAVNNPVRYWDPDGHRPEPSCNSTTSCYLSNQSGGAAAAAAKPVTGHIEYVEAVQSSSPIGTNWSPPDTGTEMGESSGSSTPTSANAIEAAARNAAEVEPATEAPVLFEADPVTGCNQHLHEVATLAHQAFAGLSLLGRNDDYTCGWANGLGSTLNGFYGAAHDAYTIGQDCGWAQACMQATFGQVAFGAAKDTVVGLFNLGMSCNFDWMCATQTVANGVAANYSTMADEHGFWFAAGNLSFEAEMLAGEVAVGAATGGTSLGRSLTSAVDDVIRTALRLDDVPLSAVDDLPCVGNSFVPGTAVLIADGTTRPIEEIQVGDLVWAADPETGEEGPRKVTYLITGHGDKTLIDIEIDGHTVTATHNHPIWADNTGEWVDA